uniref:Uncharacterized protein n=1 Tax=Zea mays TaxID=4577 RepID=A0A804QMX5_MAIZE
MPRFPDPPTSHEGANAAWAGRRGGRGPRRSCSPRFRRLEEAGGARLTPISNNASKPQGKRMELAAPLINLLRFLFFKILTCPVLNQENTANKLLSSATRTGVRVLSATSPSYKHKPTCLSAMASSSYCTMYIGMNTEDGGTSKQQNGRKIPAGFMN